MFNALVNLLQWELLGDFSQRIGQSCNSSTKTFIAKAF